VVIQVASRVSRAPFTRLPLGISPLSLNASHSSPSASFRAGENLDLTPLQPNPSMSQQILLNQVNYAKQFECEPPEKPKLPPILINFKPPGLKSWPSADPITARSPRSPTSVIYGSDIIRFGRQSSATDATRRTSHSDGALSSSRHSFPMPSPRDTLNPSTTRSSRRYSWAHSQQEQEASIEGSSRTNGISKPRPPTFGEQFFQTAPIIAPPPRASRVSSAIRA